MHSGQLLHRDMKPSNVLLNSDCHVKLCDFGLARSVAELGEDNAKDAAVLTDYVATRWYRAPEILLGSTRYTKGVDMWSIGCILGEMLGGQPMFPGKSTVNQLELVIEVTGRPNKLDMKAIKSKHTATMLETLAVKPQKSLQSLFPTASVDALDLMSKLLVFNPEKRLSVDEAIRHPYLAQFHNSADEPILSAPIHISIDDNKRYKISEYRKYLYRKIVERKKFLRAKREQQRLAQSGQMSGQPVPVGSAALQSSSSTGQLSSGSRPTPQQSPHSQQGRQQYSQQPTQQQYHQQSQQQQQQYQAQSHTQQQHQRAPSGSYQYNVPNNSASQMNAQAAGQRKPTSAGWTK